MNKILFSIIIGMVIFCHSNTKAQQLQLDSTVLTLSVVAENLEVPWEILWGPDDHIWFTERPGTVSRLNPETGAIDPLLEIEEVVTVSESGLLGMALHPNFTHPDSAFVYLVYTYNSDNLTEKLVRYTYEDYSLAQPMILLDNIPANNNHDGSRIVITLDRKILMSTGDAQNTSLSQNVNSLAGKFLRINLDGSVPEDNPNPDSPVWSMGHRNPQGLVRASNGIVYSSEHGPNNDDEINIIMKDGNYGWPNVQGFCNLSTEETFCDVNDVTEPIVAWTPTLAVAGIDYYNHPNIPEWQNAVLLSTLKEDDLRVLRLNETGDEVVSEDVYLNNEYGRLRDICVSPDGDIYIATSNHDGRANNGFPVAEDDRIIKISNENAIINSLDDLSSEVRLYPNPVRDRLFLDVKNGESVRIYDASSKLVAIQTYSDQIDFADFQKGLYFIKVTTHDGSTILGKVVKE